MTLGLSESLQSLIEAQYHKAKASSALSFASSELHILKTDSKVPFQLRFCPTLARKPIDNKPDQPKKKKDVFDNPTGDLVVGHVPHDKPSYVIVLNKFPIIPNHFILATKDFKEQTHDLEPCDLEVTLNCLKSWQAGSADNELFAFFNSGVHSGASQPHRHIQFLPVQDMARDDVSGQWQLLMQSKTNLKALPIVTFQEDLPKSMSTDELHGIYQRLLKSCRDAWTRYSSKTDAPASDFSYNMGMTTTSMVLCPRTREGVVLHDADGSELGYVALNGTLLGGTMMVKQSKEWDYLRQNPELINHILTSICLPIRHEKI